MNTNEFSPICMAEDFWKNSQLSIARHYGQIKIGKYEYVIVNREGKDIFQLSREAERDGRTMAILPGESADLCRKDFVKFYRKFGRDKFLEILTSHQHTKDTELKKYMRDL